MVGEEKCLGEIGVMRANQVKCLRAARLLKAAAPRVVAVRNTITVPHAEIQGIGGIMGICSTVLALEGVLRGWKRL
jgi:hypothetical protein